MKIITNWMSRITNISRREYSNLLNFRPIWLPSSSINGTLSATRFVRSASQVIETSSIMGFTWRYRNKIFGIYSGLKDQL